MRKIFKYSLGECFESSDGSTIIKLPGKHRITYFGDQNGVMTMWAEVDPDAVTGPVTFKIVGTGHPIPDDFDFVATAPSGPFMWHLYRKNDWR